MKAARPCYKKAFPVLLIFGILSTAQAAEYHISPAGTPTGNGSLTRPLDLTAALTWTNARPGDTFWLHGGTYKGTFNSSLQGQAGQPITVRQAPGERATIDGSLIQDAGGYTTYWGFEIMNSYPLRVSSQTGSAPTDLPVREGVNSMAPNNKFINLIVHDSLGNGFGLWSLSPNNEVNGCLIYNNGWQAPDRGHGHGIYTQNESGNKMLVNNIIFDQYAYGLQAYGSSTAYIRNINFIGNIVFNNGTLASPSDGGEITFGGSSPSTGTVFSTNAIFNNNLGAETVRMGLPNGSPDVDLRMEGNYIVGRTSLNDWGSVIYDYNTNISSLAAVVQITQTLEAYNKADFTWDHNQYFDTLDWTDFKLTSLTTQTLEDFPGWKQLTGLDASSSFTEALPTNSMVLIRPSQYEPGRANIAIYNWALSSNVTVDVRSFLSLGTRYEVHNAQNFFAPPVLTGTFDGNPISLPMTGLTPATPIAHATLPPTGPLFNAFVLIPLPAPTPTAAKISWTTPASIIYGQPLDTNQLNATANVAGTFVYTPAAGTVLNAGNNQQLSVIFMPQDTVNYLPASSSVSLNVQPAPLLITASNVSKAYGATVPALTSSYSGFVNGDAAGSLTSPVSLSTTCTQNSSVGTYPVIPSGATSSNYAITFANGSVTVVPVGLTIHADSKTKFQGGPNPPLTVCYSGFVNGETNSSLTAQVSLTTPATTGSPAGTYPIIPSGATSSNYSITYSNGLLTITPPQLVSLQVSPATASVSIGASQDFMAIGTYSDGSTSNLTSIAAWTSSNPTVATISNNGTATALTTGTVTLSAQSGGLSATASMTVNGGASAGNFANTNKIVINDVSPASPYPSTIAVSGLSGTVSKVTVTLSSVSHTWPADIGALLVGPGGQKVVLMSSVAGGNKMSNVTLTFDDAATSLLPANAPVTSGIYRPTVLGTGKFYPAPAPASPYASALASFKGSNPNGTWSLHVIDDSKGDTGAISGGWSVAIQTSSVPGGYSNNSLIVIPSVGVATPYPSAITVAGVAGTINKLTVTVTNFTHTWPHDVGMLVVGPTGQKVVLLANVGGGNKISNVTLTFDDSAAGYLPTSSPITPGAYKPTNAGTGKVFPSPAPTGPYATNLAIFNGASPNGTWSLYVVDDASGDSGAISGGWSLGLTTTTNLPSNLFVAGTVEQPSAGATPGGIPMQPAAVAPANRAVIEGVQLGAAGEFLIEFTAQAGRNYAIQASADYRDWQVIGTVTAEAEQATFADAEAHKHSLRFYRVIQMPAAPGASR